MKSYIEIAVAVGLSAAFAACGAAAEAAAAPPQGTELFRCQVQIHIRTDLSKSDSFCPSSDCIRSVIARLHANGVTAQAFTWTEGTNKDVLRQIWKLGFDNFATDDPLVLFELLPELGSRGTSNRGGKSR